MSRLSFSPATQPRCSHVNMSENLLKPSVLVVEDEPTNALIAETICRRAGFEVEAVSNGAEALKRLEARRFDVALVDVQMPVLDGLDFAEPGPQLAFVIPPGFADGDARRRAAQNGRQCKDPALALLGLRDGHGAVAIPAKQRSRRVAAGQNVGGAFVARLCIDLSREFAPAADAR